MSHRSLFLVVMLLLPIVAGVVGLPISLSNPELRPAVAKLFFAALTISGAGQAFFFGKRGTAVIILICGAVVILLIG
ncbi:MAG TPA: hypothetical protein EYP04_04545 [Anaerolineae bacterium]|nr:hypothetical protein [Anaerolineae bacterium]